jgi:hypothetical protein
MRDYNPSVRIKRLRHTMTTAVILSDNHVIIIIPFLTPYTAQSQFNEIIKDQEAN